MLSEKWLCSVRVLINSACSPQTQESEAGAHCAIIRAAVPATCGVAMDVPVSWIYSPPSPVDSTFTPGAITCTVFVP